MFVKGHRYKNTKSSVPKFPDSTEISAESAEACDTSSIRRILSQNLASDSKSEARPDSIVNIGQETWLAEAGTTRSLVISHQASNCQREVIRNPTHDDGSIFWMDIFRGVEQWNDFRLKFSRKTSTRSWFKKILVKCPLPNFQNDVLVQSGA